MQGEDDPLQQFNAGGCENNVVDIKQQVDSF
jgi:hypothetical protein